MKTSLAVVFLLLISVPAIADVVIEREPDATVENVTLALSTGMAVLNITTSFAQTPYYWAGAAGIAVGITALGLTANDNCVHRHALVAVGTATIVTGLIAMRYRHVLDAREAATQIEISWENGSPGLAFVVNF